MHDDNTTILHHQFKSSSAKDTNNSFQCTNTGYLKVLSSLQVNTDTTTLQNSIVKAKVTHQEEDRKLEIGNDNSSRSEDTTFEDAAAELKEIISNSHYLSENEKEFQRVMTMSPILRAQNPIHFNKPFMNNKGYEYNTFQEFKLDF